MEDHRCRNYSCVSCYTCRWVKFFVCRVLKSSLKYCFAIISPPSRTLQYFILSPSWHLFFCIKHNILPFFLKFWRGSQFFFCICDTKVQVFSLSYYFKMFMSFAYFSYEFAFEFIPFKAWICFFWQWKDLKWTSRNLYLQSLSLGNPFPVDFQKPRDGKPNILKTFHGKNREIETIFPIVIMMLDAIRIKSCHT